MFCPKCRGEFREGFTHCKKCDTDLVEELLPLDEEEIKKNTLIYKVMSLSIDKWLKIGGIVLIVISVFYELINTVRNIYQYSNFGHPDVKNICLAVFAFVYSVIRDSMWGLFYIALGYIIKLLKQGTNNEK